MKAYKGFNKDLTCRGFQYEVGKEYEMAGPVKLCERGFHACENPLDVLGYYGDVLSHRYCEVEQSGEIVKDSDKTVSGKIRIIREIGFTELIAAGIEWLKGATASDKRGTDDGDDHAQIGSSGDFARIASTGEDSVFCCAGHRSRVKAKRGSWITLSEWVYSQAKKKVCAEMREDGVCRWRANQGRHVVLSAGRRICGSGGMKTKLYTFMRYLSLAFMAISIGMGIAAIWHKDYVSAMIYTATCAANHYYYNYWSRLKDEAS